jgi:magnesium-transporting ATPase (P-type)
MVFLDTTKVVCPDGSIADINDTTDVPDELLNGDKTGTTDTYMGIFERTVKKFADQAFRTILVCFRDMSMEEFENLKSANNDFEKAEDRGCLETDLTAMGIFGLQDPLRP